MAKLVWYICLGALLYVGASAWLEASDGLSGYARDFTSKIDCALSGKTYWRQKC